MLELGLGDEVQEIGNHITVAQRFFFSATWPRGVHRIIADMVRPDKLVTVRITEENTLPGPAKAIKQEVKFVAIKRKKDSFLSWIRRVLMSPAAAGSPPRILVFVGRREGADVLAREIERVARWPCAVMHGDRFQADREAALGPRRSERQSSCLGFLQLLFDPDRHLSWLPPTSLPEDWMSRLFNML
mmetsp:Transcript_69659/g.185536  ORF Transcript_69659/g.185536 Transcript_69659/m.185536 type:complete len:187 (-) Transcript_69659:270-830(-)